MSFPKLEVGDLVLTRQYDGGQSVEICQYRAATGNLMYMMYHPEALLTCQLERFIKDHDSMPHSVSIVRKSDSVNYAGVLAALHECEKSKMTFEGIV